MSTKSNPRWLLLLLAPITMAWLTATPLDPAFGTDGVASATIGTYGTVGKKMVLQGDGKTVVCGRVLNTVSPTSYGYDVGLARFDTNGSLDPTFGVGGKLSTDIGSSHPVYTDDWGNAVVVQPDGRIVVAGSTRRYTKTSSVSSFARNLWDVLLLRYLPNGSLDADFGNNGRVIMDLNGTGLIPDTTFNSTGKLAMSVGARSQGWGLATDATGRILVSGNAQASSSSNQQALILCFNPNGTLDSGFNGTGIFTTSIGEYSAQSMIGLKVGNDGAIIAAGVASTSSSWIIARVRINANGTTDDTFGPAGMATTALAGASNLTIGNCAVQNDGKLVLGGGFQTTLGQHFAVLRYQATGLNTRPDGIPLDWIVNHFGSNENAPDEVIKDGRTVSLLLAYLMGENPLDPQDLLRIENCGITQDGLRLEFHTLAGRVFQIESSVEIAVAGWGPEGTRILGDGTVAVVLLPKDAVRKFYRIAISLP